MKRIYHLDTRELLEDFSSILVGFIISTIVAVGSIILYIQGYLAMIYLRAILFLYVMSFMIILLRLYFIQIIKRVGEQLGFKLITPFYLQPRIEGHYKGNWFQVHYRSKESGTDPGILRTYVKLQYKKPMKFIEKKFDKYTNYNFKNHHIIVIKHLKRPNKNYLLLKRRGFTFERKDLIQLMDFLLKIAKESKS